MIEIQICKQYSAGIFWNNCTLLSFNSILCWALGPQQIVPKQTVAVVYATAAPECLTLTNCLLQCKWWHATLAHEPKLHTLGIDWADLRGCLMKSAPETFCCTRAGREVWQPALHSNTSNPQSYICWRWFVRNTDFPEKFCEKMIAPKVPEKCFLADCSPSHSLLSSSPTSESASKLSSSSS